MNTHLSYGDAVFVIGDGDAAVARAAAAAVAAGWDIAARSDPDGALAAFDDATFPPLLFVEVDGSSAHDGAAGLDALLLRLEIEARSGRCAAVVSTPPALIDLVAARAASPRIVQIAGATDAERALALAEAARPVAGRVREGEGGGSEAARLLVLTEEVARIAGALARLSGGALRPGAEPGAPPSVAPVDDVADAAELRRIVRARRLRGRHFDPALFADPAWDMLLDLAAARLAGKTVAVSSLCIAAAVPPTTALRWIRMLTDAELFVRQADPADGRRVFIELSDAAAAGMRAYLAALRRDVP